MRILGLDLETTGLDTAQDRITEIGLVLWDAKDSRPLVTVGAFYYDPSYEEKFTPEVTQMMGDLCGITPEMLREFGTSPKANLEWLDKFCHQHRVEAVVAHNGENYDKPLLMAELSRNGVAADFFRSLHWIDTRQDLPWEKEPSSRRLTHLAADSGFINPFEHRAVFDVLTMLKVLSQYDIATVIENSKIPFITVRAMVGYADRQLAKDQRYSWEKLGEKTWQKSWVKKIRENQFELEKQKCQFEVVRIE